MVCRVATRRLSVVGGRDGCRRLFWPRLDTQFGHSVPDFGLCVAGALFCPVAGNQTARSLAGAGCRGSGDAAWAVLAACLCSHSARSEEHTSELQSLMRISYAVFCL